MRILSVMTSVSLGMLLVACGGNGSETNSNTANSLPVVKSTQDVAISFAAQANGADVKCGAVNEVANLGTSNKTAQIQDLRFYISNLKLINSKGEAVAVSLTANDYQDFGVALLDFEDATGACSAGTADTYTAITGTVPSDTYTGIEFSLGVPDTGTDAIGKSIALNHSAITKITKPLDIAAMDWGWQLGRKFAKIELQPTSGVINQKGTPDTTDDAVVSSWVVHIGSTNCTGTDATGYSCTNANLANITLNNFEMSKQTVVFDLAALLANSDIGINQNGAVGCMSGATDKECPALFEAFGLDLATGNGSATKTQTVFKVMNK
ncbi:MAG: metallo-mystery pair system four-Cys motif protein [Moraxellaceae bacterium]|nr:metallo-mystery pair system four-Cys motif protein [Pseudomonadales bacterium]MCP5173637.1 metallo-mystery pair system four-Cys motif protein [Moraxellaceae bacterium]MCP5178161.1 metallo-mystery pair system four-Cys motif protein [Moraxellaceae bacterium]